ncbi:long-chain-acyl-CoA synthetase [Methylobacterium haplocladii]|uniref:Long-chain-acyl-CoA synthetase n=1 Tax=Methylobacterium haplocladii TaxID=1176176 RepID=A0A512IJE4_9HYPH|nr:long-chain-acyl-CoA synthetase [Methylobacterium haplocladii]GEO97823.1 long-chain-acyl-CoA synthetase [Methylobacterium haplocladii]GJD82669.1 Long-chain-fatty-acid--CoA ligase [Methylobacterium haplocladii]GLS57544.1 long-chain-acyl-CoA synthetase [Methylobacterium haplocladii]
MAASPLPPPSQRPSSTSGWIGALERTARIDAQPERIFPRVIDELATRHGTAPALIGTDETLSHRDLAARQNRYARWALARGLVKGETVALLMTNRPDFLAIWLGLTRVGVRVALLNTNLRDRSLAHCIDVAAPRLLILEADLAEAVASAQPHLAKQPDIVWQGPGAGGPSLAEAAAGYSEAPLQAGEGPAVTVRDEALLIFTSGTTGLPKAARVSHHRIMMWTHWFAGLIDAGADDRMYNCLPLYHSVGGVVAPGSVLIGGGSVVIRPKFSASAFWRDVTETGATVFQYIGELCRYLTVAPPDPFERRHALRLCTGNGMRPDVWERFRERFAIPRILEFYAATEGTVSLYNVEGRLGAVGRVPPFMARRSPALIVRHDVETGLPLRDAAGRCVPADPDEPGELLGRLSAKAEHSFEGYTSAEETSRKIVRDALQPGDAWMRTGDLMRKDAQGFFYFVDRIGDTFRWKGENVATTEVAEVLGHCPGVLEASVYGVAVPGSEGKAGMAALTTGASFDIDALHAALAEGLPAYARPVFLRIVQDFAHTETFKQKKAVLAAEGFDPERIGDALYIDRDGQYRPLDPATYAAVGRGDVRL